MTTSPPQPPSLLWSLFDFWRRADPVEELHSRDRGEGVRATYTRSYHTECCVWLKITCQSFHLMCQLAWLALSSQCKWAYSAASWQSRASDKGMVQTWHTFKKFLLPSLNPLHCRQGWHVPNEIAVFVSENSPPLPGIVSSKSTRCHSWRHCSYCYPYFPDNDFFCAASGHFLTFLMKVTAALPKDLTEKIITMPHRIKRKKDTDEPWFRICFLEVGHIFKMPCVVTRIWASGGQS